MGRGMRGRGAKTRERERPDRDRDYVSLINSGNYCNVTVCSARGHLIQRNWSVNVMFKKREVCVCVCVCVCARAVCLFVCLFVCVCVSVFLFVYLPMSFLFLFLIGKRQGKPKKLGFVYPYRTPKSLEKKRKTLNKQGNPRKEKKTLGD